MPISDELFAKVSGAKFFTKIDFAPTYNQLKVNVTCSELLPIKTHKESVLLYMVVFCAISNAGALFQSILDNILPGIENTYSYVNDILLIT